MQWVEKVPPEVWEIIAAHCPQDIMALAGSCRHFRRIFDDRPSLAALLRYARLLAHVAASPDDYLTWPDEVGTNWSEQEVEKSSAVD